MTLQPLLNPASRLRPILLVEDSDMDLDLCLQALREQEVAHPVIACRDGDEALDFIKDHPVPEDPRLPLLVLLDLNLPKVDGVEVLRQARLDPVWDQVPVIVLTTSCAPEDVAAVYGLGGNSFLVKPVDFNAFAEVMERIKAYWLQCNVPPFGASGRPG